MATPPTAEAQGMAALHAHALAEMTTLISQRLPYFRRMALRCLDNRADAEDAVQDAFLSAWKNLHRFRGQAQMSTWLTVIVMNAARMVMRKRSRSPHVSLDGQIQEGEESRFFDLLSDNRPGPEAQAARRELEDRLQRLSVHLSPNLRNVIRLRGLEGLSTREAAEALGLTESALKTRAARAREQLRQLDESHPALGIAAARRPPRRRRTKAAPPTLA
jgi:RNA polymerase sigma-70 factor, ECF subfamily